MKAALRAEEALCADETPISVVSNASEDAAAAPGRAVSGYWHSLATLARYCRVRSYLASSVTTASGPSTPSTPPSPDTPGLPAPVSAWHQPLNGTKAEPNLPIGVLTAETITGPIIGVFSRNPL